MARRRCHRSDIRDDKAAFVVKPLFIFWRKKRTEYVWETAEEIDQQLAGRVRNIRRRRSISQEKLSSMSGVSLGSG